MKNSQIYVGTPEDVNARLQKFEKIQNARGCKVSFEVSSPSLTVHNGEILLAITVSLTTYSSNSVDDPISV